MNRFNGLESHSYINLETFRKSGIGVRTPVWFVEDGSTLFVRTDATSGKVKRIQNNGQVHVAPCKMDGALLGDWMEASARVADGEEIDRKVDRLLGKKYGFMKIIFSLASSLQRRKSTIIEIRVAEQ
mgnify:CR=1 FL=1